MTQYKENFKFLKKVSALYNIVFTCGSLSRPLIRPRLFKEVKSGGQRYLDRIRLIYEMLNPKTLLANMCQVILCYTATVIICIGLKRASVEFRES